MGEGQRCRVDSVIVDQISEVIGVEEVRGVTR